VFENRMLKRIVVPTIDEIKGDWNCIMRNKQQARRPERWSKYVPPKRPLTSWNHTASHPRWSPPWEPQV
jgi:hypothetical protein